MTTKKTPSASKKNIPATVTDIAAQFTTEELEQLLAQKRTPPAQSPLQVGNRVHIKTLSFFYIGTVAHVGPDTLLLTNAEEVYQTGKMEDHLDKGSSVRSSKIPGVLEITRSHIACVASVGSK